MWTGSAARLGVSGGIAIALIGVCLFAGAAVMKPEWQNSLGLRSEATLALLIGLVLLSFGSGVVAGTIGRKRNWSPTVCLRVGSAPLLVIGGVWATIGILLTLPGWGLGSAILGGGIAAGWVAKKMAYPGLRLSQFETLSQNSIRQS